MALYSTRMNVTFSMVVYVESDSAEDARRSLKNGEWEDYDISTAEAVDWEDPGQVTKENE